MKTKPATPQASSFIPLTCLLLALAILPVQAQTTYYWNTANGTWTNGANWSDNATSGGTTGVAPTAADSVVFNQSSVNGAEIITVPTLSIQGMTFNNTGTTGLQTDGTNRAITLGAGGITIGASAGPVTFGNTTTNYRIGFVLGANQTWTNDRASLSLNTNNNIGLGSNTLTFAGSGNFNVATSISGNGGVTANQARDIASGSVTHSFTGVLTLNSGTFSVWTLANVNIASNIGKGSAGGSAADIVFGGGTLRKNNQGATSTNRLFTIGNSNGLTATLDSSTAQADRTLSFTGTGAIGFGGSGARTLTLTGSNTGNATNSNIFAPILGDGAGGATSLVKSGAGTWVLTGANTYTGETFVSAGALLLSSTGSLAAGSAVTVASGGAIGGEGTISGNLTLNSGAKFVFDLNDNPLTVSGTFALNNTFGVDDLVTSSLGAINWSTVGIGTYKLLNTSFVFNAGNIQNFGISNAFSSGGKFMYFENGSLDLVVAVPEPSTWALLAFSLSAASIVALRRRKAA